MMNLNHYNGNPNDVLGNTLPVKPAKLPSRVINFINELDKKSSSESSFKYESRGFRSVKQFLDFSSNILINGDLYIFGGLLRELASKNRLSNRFTSDIDLVVEGDWQILEKYFVLHDGVKNKFGGYRFYIQGWQIDIWPAAETWAIKNHIVPYEGIRSLLNTTILNWDAILMNWRTKKLIHQKTYISELSDRRLDLVLEENPDPLGMAAKVYRKISNFTPTSITYKAQCYLQKITRLYTLSDLKEREFLAYGTSIIEEAIYEKYASMSS